MTAVSDVGTLPEAKQRRPLVALLAASVISETGNRITTLAIPWYVLSSGGSGLQVGLVGFFNLVPTVLIAFLGGGLADRFGARRISVAGDLVSGISVAMIPLLHATTGLPFAGLLALVFVGAVLDAPGSTARSALLPDLIARSGMAPERANSAQQTMNRLAGLLGPLIGGGLIALLGAVNVLWLDAASFLVSAALVWRIVPALRVAATTSERYLTQLREGWRWALRRSLFVWIVALILITNMLDAAIFSVTVPIFVRQDYGSAGALGLLFAVMGVGAVSSAILYGMVGARMPRRETFTLAFIGVGLPQIVLAFHPSLVLACAALFLSGFCAGPINPVLMTVQQERVPVAMRGRVFGMVRAMAWVGMPLGVLGGGVLVDAVGTSTTFLITVGLYVLTTVGMAFSPALRQMNERVHLAAGSDDAAEAAVG